MRSKRTFEDTVAAACEAAANFLARREHSARELSLKLGKKGYSEDVLADALVELRRRDWLNETRFAAFIARHRASQGRGPRWVAAELSQEEVDWDQACAYALARMKTADPLAKQRHKLYQRGFASEHIASAQVLVRSRAQAQP
jgi:SOS response regulatory protein OraA/RecX